MGIDWKEHKELPGMYISSNEAINFWLSVLTNLQNRGDEDILIVRIIAKTKCPYIKDEMRCFRWAYLIKTKSDG